MKRFLIIFLLIGNILYAQDTSGFNSTQRKSLRDSLAIITNTLDSLGTEIEALGVGSFPLAYGKMFIGDANGAATARTISGDFTINYLGVGAIGTGKVTNAMLAGSISPSKLLADGKSISEVEFSYLDGMNMNIKDAFEAINTGSGYISAIEDDDVNANTTWLNNKLAMFGTDQDLMIGHDGTYNSFASQNVPIQFGTTDAQPIIFTTNNTNRLSLNSSGHVVPETTNAVDLGSSSKNFRYAYLHDLVLHRYASTPSFADGRAYQGSGETAGRWYMQYLDQDDIEHTVYAAPIDEVIDSLDNRLKLNTIVPIEESMSDSIDFTETNIVHSRIISDEQDITLYFKNFSRGLVQRVEVEIAIGNTITVSPPSGVTLLWQDKLPIEVNETGDYVLWFTYKDSNKCYVDWAYYGEEE